MRTSVDARPGVLLAACVALACEEPSLVEPTLAVGDLAACVLEEDGVLRCWGEYEWPIPAAWTGADDPSKLYVVPPVEIPRGAVHADVAGHLCAVTTDGEIWCWGDAPAVGFEEDRKHAAATVTRVGPRFILVRTGYARTCGIADDGSLWCWGSNQRGQLGLAHTEDIGDDETPVSAGPLMVEDGIRDVALGFYETCALTESGDVLCWGDEQPSAAAAVPLDLGGPAVQVTAGSAHACARLEDGSVVCWGDGADGRLGYGDVPPDCWCDSDPRCCVGDDEAPANRGSVPLGGPAIDVAAGVDHTCAVLDDGTVRCWGSNDVGALGLGRLDVVGDDETPLDAGAVDVGGSAVRIEAASEQTCAELEDGTVRCWGLTERWDGTTDYDCMVEVPNPSAGSICEPATILEFSCAPIWNCCIGDDEAPARTLPVPL
jgi:hypothetical protein